MTRRQKRLLKKAIKKLVNKTFYLGCILLFLWFSVSWIEVITHSLEEHNYWKGNMFYQMTESIRE